MKFYRTQPNEVVAAIDRCYLDADQGRFQVALHRIEELDQQFPNHANIHYAMGQFYRDELGSAEHARHCFKRAYDSAVKSNKENTAWLSTCNIVGLAANGDESRSWVNVALQQKGTKQDECQSFAEKVRALDSGRSYIAHLVEQVDRLSQNDEVRVAAALLEIVLNDPSTLPADVRLSLTKQRMNLLRQMDIMAERKRGCLGESVSKEERLALQEALKECARAIEQDPYDASLWNYRCAWSNILQRYEEAIEYANQAITLRPCNYPRPHYNKATSLWELGRRTEALASAQEALAQAPGSELGPEVIQEANALVKLYSVPPAKIDLLMHMQRIKIILSSAQETADKDIRRFNGAVSMSAVVDRLFNHHHQTKAQPFKGYVPMMDELLSMFTPETAYVASLLIYNEAPNSNLVEYISSAALYLACQGSGVQVRDAARYQVLMTLHFPDPEVIRKYYRQAFLSVAATGKPPFHKADTVMREELATIHHTLPALIADQPPITAGEIQAAMRNLVSHFEGSPPPIVSP